MRMLAGISVSLIIFFYALSSTAQTSPNLPGDINGDGQTDALDAALALRYGVFLDLPPTHQAERSADVSGDNRINALDAALILQMGVQIRPKIAIQSEPQGPVTLPREVQFSASVLGGKPPFAYAWNFDGISVQSTQVAPTVTYATEGLYPVTLALTDSEGLVTKAFSSVLVDVTPPDPPENLRSIPLNGSCKLFWDDSSSTESILEYRLYRKAESEGEFTRLTDEPLADFFWDTHVTPGTTYEYYATAIDEASNESIPSATVSTTPGARLARPRWKALTASGDQVELQWHAVNGAVGYHLYYSEASSNMIERIDDATPAETTFNKTEMPMNQVVYFALSAVDSAGIESELSFTRSCCVYSATADTNSDGIPDGWCTAYGIDPSTEIAGFDHDGDGLDTLEEFENATNPWWPDTDYDKAKDGVEVHTMASDPLDEDTDAGGLQDGLEQILSLDPNNAVDDLPAPAENIRALDIREGELLLTWDPSPAPATIGYNIYMNRLDGSGYQKVNTVSIDAPFYSLSSLPLNTVFIIGIRSVGAGNVEGPFGDGIQGIFAVASAGSVLNLEMNHAGLQVPAGAVLQDTLLGMVTSPEIDIHSPGFSAIEFLPNGFHFEKQVQMTLPYNAAWVTNELADQLALAWFNGQGWERLDDITHDSVNHTVSAWSSHFSTVHLTGIKPSNSQNDAALEISKINAYQRDKKLSLQLELQGEAFHTDIADSIFFAVMNDMGSRAEALQNYARTYGQTFEVEIYELWGPFLDKFWGWKIYTDKIHRFCELHCSVNYPDYYETQYKVKNGDWQQESYDSYDYTNGDPDTSV